jgi:hypothetical protein
LLFNDKFKINSSIPPARIDNRIRLKIKIRQRTIFLQKHIQNIDKKILNPYMTSGLALGQKNTRKPLQLRETFFNAFFALFNADSKTTKKELSITPYMYT